MSSLIIESKSCPGTKEISVLKNDKVFKRKKQVLHCDITIDINMFKSLDEIKSVVNKIRNRIIVGWNKL